MARRFFFFPHRVDALDKRLRNLVRESRTFSSSLGARDGGRGRDSGWAAVAQRRLALSERLRIEHPISRTQNRASSPHSPTPSS
jgi:hypothetical protein